MGGKVSPASDGQSNGIHFINETDRLIVEHSNLANSSVCLSIMLVSNGDGQSIRSDSILFIKCDGQTKMNDFTVVFVCASHSIKQVSNRPSVDHPPDKPHL